MKKSPIFALSAASLLGLFFLFTPTNAQTASTDVGLDQGYEVMLQVVVGSNSPDQGTALPQNLAAISKRLEKNFAFSAYRLENTYIGRVGNSGNLEYKSVSNILGRGVDTDAPSFLEWSFGGLKLSANSGGQAIFQAQPFRFGARVPIRTSIMREEGSKTVSNVNYESIGISMNRLSLRENTPTLIGNLSLPSATGTLFLVLTVRPVDQ